LAISTNPNLIGDPPVFLVILASRVFFITQGHVPLCQRFRYKPSGGVSFSKDEALAKLGLRAVNLVGISYRLFFAVTEVNNKAAIPPFLTFW